MKNITGFLAKQSRAYTMFSTVEQPKTVYLFPQTNLIPKFLLANVAAMGLKAELVPQSGVPFKDDVVVSCVNVFDALAALLKSHKTKVPKNVKELCAVTDMAELTSDQRKILGIFVPNLNRPAHVIPVDETVPPVEKIPAPKKTKVVSKQAKSKMPVTANANGEKIAVTSEGIDPEDAL